MPSLYIGIRGFRLLHQNDGQTLKDESDDRLVELARKGNEAAFRAIVDRYEQKVATTVIGMLGNGTEADDVGQETFIRFFRSLDQFRGDAALGTYLTRIAINLSLNEIKRRRRWMQMFSPIENEEFPEAPSKQYEDNDEAKLVHKAVKQLKPAFRAVVMLRMIHGYSTRETAEMLNVPVGTVLSRLARAQDKLKEILSPYMQNDETQSI